MGVAWRFFQSPRRCTRPPFKACQRRMASIQGNGMSSFCLICLRFGAACRTDLPVPTPHLFAQGIALRAGALSPRRLQ